MTIKDYKCKCGHDDFFFANKGNQKGIYCSYCGKWYKWADKDEQNLTLNKESILDKIRDEIEQNAYSIVYGVNNHEKGMTLYGILQIIDKYKAEMRNSYG